MQSVFFESGVSLVITFLTELWRVVGRFSIDIKPLKGFRCKLIRLGYAAKPRQRRKLCRKNRTRVFQAASASEAAFSRMEKISIENIEYDIRNPVRDAMAA